MKRTFSYKGGKLNHFLISEIWVLFLELKIRLIFNVFLFLCFGLLPIKLVQFLISDIL